MKLSKITSYIFLIASSFVWIGFVCSISFMEAWLKFRAPNVTLALGLNIGQLVFAALNKVEWTLSLIILINIFLSSFKLTVKKQILFIISFLILIIQTFLLLPALNERAQFLSQGINVSPSYVHFSYLFCEIAKVLSLFIFGTSLINDLNRNYDDREKKIKKKC